VKNKAMQEWHGQQAKEHVLEAKRLLCVLLNDFHDPEEADRILNCAAGQIERARYRIELVQPRG
jgi:hypothetical protein